MKIEKPRCPTCGRLRVLSTAERSALIATALAAAKKRGAKIGRPKQIDDKAVASLRARGYSMVKIAEILHVSKGSVQHSLRKK